MSQTTHPRRCGNLLRHRRIGSLFFAFVLTLSPVAAARPQTDDGQLSVTVTEENSGAILSGAGVTLGGKGGGRKQCVTDDEGRCTIGSIDPGYYVIYVRRTQDAVKPDASENVYVGAGQRISRVVSIPAESQARTVAADDPQSLTPTPTPTPPPTPTPSPTPAASLPPEAAFVDPLAEKTSPGRLGVTATTADAEELPNRTRDEAPFFDLLQGVFNTTDEFRGVIFNGQPGSQNVLREGGFDTTPLVLSSASFQDTGAFIFNIADRQSLKSYESFTVNTSNTPAKLGTGTGGQLLRDITSGGEDFKGELYYYFANDALSARNFFDTERKPSLRFNLFGGNLSGPLPSFGGDDSRLFAFFNYEGIRASSGNVIFEAAPSLALRERAAPAVAPLFDSFRAGGASVVTNALSNTNASSDPNFDILRLEAKNRAKRDGITLRFDFEPNDTDSVNLVYLGFTSREEVPEGVSGRRNITRNTSHAAAINYKRALTRTSTGVPKLTNQLVFGFKADPVRAQASSHALQNPDLTQGVFSIGGEVAHTGIVGQPFPFAVGSPGGLLRGNFKGRDLDFSPRRFSFADQLEWSSGANTLTFGGEVRFIRASLGQRFGTTYSFATLDDFLANRAAVESALDLGSFNGDTGGDGRKAAQEYYIGYAQHGWSPSNTMRLTYGLRYEYYSVLREARDRAVVFDPETGTVLPQGTPFYRSRKNNFLPRAAFVWAPGRETLPGDKQSNLATGPTVISASFGMHVGPDVFDNLLRPIVSDRVTVAQDAGAFPLDPAALAAAPAQNRRLRPLALARDYTSPARVYKFDVTVKRELIGRVLVDDAKPTQSEDAKVERELFVTLTYQGERSRDLLLRNFGNPITGVETNPDPTRPATIRRRFDMDNGSGIPFDPYGDVEYLTTGGWANYDSLQVSMTGRVGSYLRFVQAGYTLARNYGNTDGDSAIGAGNPSDYDYDTSYNAIDVRHKFSFGTAFFLDCVYDFCRDRPPFVRELLGGWRIAAIGSFQVGAPLDLRLKRPDVVYEDGNGAVFSSPAAGRRAVLNTPGGGSSVAAYRPNLIPGVNPYLDGFDGRRFLNPAAFSVPAPGTLGDLPRGYLRGPGVQIVDLSFRKQFGFSEWFDVLKSVDFNIDITNVFNHTNYRPPPTVLNAKLGLDAGQQQVQPGQPITLAATDTFGILNRTFKRKQDLGASRQLQFGLSFKF